MQSASTGALPFKNSDESINSACMGHARLYEDEITDYLNIYNYRVPSFKKSFNDDEAFDQFEEREKCREVARFATKNDEAFAVLDDFLFRDQKDLWRSIHLSSVSPISPSFISFRDRLLIPSGPFLVIDRVAAVLDIEALLPNFCANDKYPSLRNAAMSKTQSGDLGKKKRIAQQFLRAIPLLEESESDWFHDLLDACRKDAHNLELTLNYLCENWRDELASRSITIPSSSTENVLIAGASCRPPREFESFRNEKMPDRPLTLPVLRGYQRELVERADQGQNVVVCAPTGSGKTVVAAHLALRHLQEKKMKLVPARVVMVVPKVFLVKQQADLFRNYAGRSFYVVELSGDTIETGGPQLLKALSSDILVLTPQILVNMLQSPNENARLYVADMTLLLLDECHHTDKKNPYNVIMDEFVKKAEFERPQVVGLTASLGVGESGIVDEEMALRHCARICIRLSTSCIVTVVKNQSELSQFVPPPNDAVKLVEHSCDRPFQDALFQKLKDTELKLQAEFVLLRKEKPPHVDLDKLCASFPDHQKMEEYIQCYTVMGMEAALLSNGMRKWRIKRGLDFIKLYHMAMLQNDLLPSSRALDQLLLEIKSLEQSAYSCDFHASFTASKDILVDLASFEEDKPILRCLREQLISQFSAKEDSRVIIFCLRRETAQLLAKYLTEYDIRGVGKVEALTSTNAAGARNGQNNSGQRAAIEAFSNGEIKVLVSTSVAEEGLDVPACNLIVKYNTVGNVISLVQQRGRARALNSRSILLTVSSKEANRENLNQMAEKVMSKCLVTIHKMGDVAFGVIIEQERLNAELQMEKTRKEEEARRPAHKELNLDCEKCGEFICHSSTVRIIHNHYITVDGSFWKRVQLKAKIGGYKHSDGTIADKGEVNCRCGRLLGNIIKSRGVYLPALKADSIVFKTTAGEALKKEKKWKGVTARLLAIPDGQQHEIEAMHAAFSSTELSQSLQRLSLL